MAVWGVNLEEVKNFTEQMNQLRDLLKNTSEEIQKIEILNKNKDFIKNFIKFLKYSNVIDSKNFICYRVRKCLESKPFVDVRDLLYPPKEKTSLGRMNDSSTILLYTSFNEFTAISESRISEIGSYFQLTKFEAEEDIKIFNIGRFSQILFNSPRDSLFMQEIIRAEIGDLSDGFIRGLSSLEQSIMDFLYNREEDYFISSYISNSIFSEMEVDAIMYPSMQNKFGTNFAIKKSFVDNSLKIVYSNFNELTEVYKNGFFKYDTKQECIDFSIPHTLNFNLLDKKNYSRHQYRG